MADLERARTIQQIGSSFGDLLIAPPTPKEPYPPLPAEVDDIYITPTQLGPQPAGIISKLTGFNANVRIYSTCNALTTMELAYGIDEVFDLDRQKRVLEESFRAVKQALVLVPDELTIHPTSRNGCSKSAGAYRFTSTQNVPRKRPDGFARNDETELTPAEQRQLQYEIQKANIYASQLGTRSYIVEKYWTLLDVYNQRRRLQSLSMQESPGVMAASLDSMLPSTDNLEMSELQMSIEREEIVKDLLKVLGSIEMVNMEPNGLSFVRLSTSSLYTSSSLQLCEYNHGLSY